MGQLLKWTNVAPEVRAILAAIIAAGTFVPVFLFAPADDLRVTAAALIAGCLTAVVCWQHFPAWDIMAAGLAFAVAGSYHAVDTQNWVFQACLVLPALVFWYLGARLGENRLVFPLGYDDNTGEMSWTRIQQEGRKGLVVSGLLFATTWWFLGFFVEAWTLLDFPFCCLATYLVCSRWHIKRPLWPALGLLIALPLAGLVMITAARVLQAAPPTLADPWLLGGLMISGSTIGLWVARWRLAWQLSAQRCSAPSE